MTKRSKETASNPGSTREDWDEVSDNPERTEEDFAKARAFAEVFPKPAENIGRARRVQKEAAEASERKTFGDTKGAAAQY